MDIEKEDKLVKEYKLIFKTSKLSLNLLSFPL